MTRPSPFGIFAPPMKKIILIIALAAFSILISSASAQKRPEVGGRITTGPTTELLSIAIEDIKIRGAFPGMQDSMLAQDIKKTLKDDLAFSLYFNIVEVDTGFMKNFAKGKMTLDDWIYLGAQMLISGRMEREADGILLSVDVTDIYRNKNAYNRDFVGTPDRYRYMVHQIASDLLYRLIGEEGCYYSKIAYSCNSSGAWEIYHCDFDGYGATQITRDNSINILPSWSNDGDKIYYTGYKKNNPDLYAYSNSQSKGYVISARNGLNSAAAASPDGKFIACTLTMGGNSEIFLLDSNGKIVKQLTVSSAIDTSPSWAPLSREIAFTSDRAGGPQIYITDVDGTSVRRLTFLGDYNDQPTWSPLGDLIAYTSRDADGFQIYTIDIAGLNPRQLTEIGANMSPSWSPDGLHLVYSSNISGKTQIYVMDYNGLNKKVLDLPGDCKTPKWSKNIK